MAENHEPGKWDAVVCSGFAAVNVLSSTNVEELGWDYTEMELDPTGTCGLFDGMLLDWDDDTPEERREHEEFFPDAFTVGARILADDWDHEIGNDEVRSRSFREDIFNMPQNRPVGLAVLATLPLDAFVDASLSMICRGDCENAGTFTVKPGRYEPILGIYDPVGGCGGAMGTVLDCDFEIDPHDISYTMMEPVRGEWKSDRIDLYTPQDCFGFSDPFGGRIEYNEKKPEVVVAAKPDPVELGHRASVAAGSTAGGRARGAGIRQ